MTSIAHTYELEATCDGGQCKWSRDKCCRTELYWLAVFMSLKDMREKGVMRFYLFKIVWLPDEAPPDEALRLAILALR